MSVSPFTGGPGWEVVYGRISPKWEGIRKIIDSLTPRDRAIGEALARHMFLTGIQVAEIIEGRRRNVLKNRLNMLARSGFLLRHLLKCGPKVLPVYSLSHIGQKELGIKGKYGWWRSYTAYRLFLLLSFNQLALKVSRIGGGFNIDLDPPAVGRINLAGQEFTVLSIRDWGHEVGEIERYLNRTEGKAILISAKEDSALAVGSMFGNSRIRYTLDEWLLREPIQHCFFVYHRGRLYKEDIPLLKNLAAKGGGADQAGTAAQPGQQAGSSI